MKWGNGAGAGKGCAGRSCREAADTASTARTGSGEPGSGWDSTLQPHLGLGLSSSSIWEWPGGQELCRASPGLQEVPMAQRGHPCTPRFWELQDRTSTGEALGRIFSLRQWGDGAECGPGTELGVLPGQCQARRGSRSCQPGTAQPARALPSSSPRAFKNHLHFLQRDSDAFYLRLRKQF